MIWLLMELALADKSQLDDFDIREETSSAAFLVGRDSDVGNLFYVIDRTHQLCFAALKQGPGVSLTKIDCGKLRRSPTMERFWRKGETP